MSNLNGMPKSVGDFFPVLQEGHSPQSGAVLRLITVPLGPPLLVDGATYKQALFIAPCDGCQIKEVWLTAAVAMAGGTDTFALDNYDKSGSAARNVLSTATIDPTGVTAKKGTQLTVSTTEANLLMDEGDVLNATLVCGTMTTDGEGYCLTAAIYVPDLN